MDKTVLSSYTADILRNYGNAGRKIDLPNRDNDTYARGLQFREKEKAYYADLERKLAQSQRALAKSKGDAAHYKQTATQFAAFINELEQTFSQSGNDDADHSSGRRRDTNGDSGGGVLPTEGRASADDDQHGSPEEIISRTGAVDGASNVGSRRARRDNDEEHIGEESSEHGTQRHDSGRASTRPTDGAEPDGGGSANEHSDEK